MAVFGVVVVFGFSVHGEGVRLRCAGTGKRQHIRYRPMAHVGEHRQLREKQKPGAAMCRHEFSIP